MVELFHLLLKLFEDRFHEIFNKHLVLKSSYIIKLVVI